VVGGAGVVVLEVAGGVVLEVDVGAGVVGGEVDVVVGMNPPPQMQHAEEAFLHPLAAFALSLSSVVPHLCPGPPTEEEPSYFSQPSHSVPASFQPATF
jgi:hypothetical protein